MVSAAPDQPIFADISYFSEVLDRHSQQRKDALACMRRFRETFPNSDRILLYGTDWSMIGHEDKFITNTKFLPDIVAEFYPKPVTICKIEKIYSSAMPYVSWHYDVLTEEIRRAAGWSNSTRPQLKALGSVSSTG